MQECEELQKKYAAQQDEQFLEHTQQQHVLYQQEQQILHQQIQVRTPGLCTCHLWEMILSLNMWPQLQSSLWMIVFYLYQI